VPRHSFETTAAGAGRGAARVAGEEPLQAARPEAINPAPINLISVIRPVATLASDYRHRGAGRCCWRSWMRLHSFAARGPQSPTLNAPAPGLNSPNLSRVASACDSPREPGLLSRVNFSLIGLLPVRLRPKSRVFFEAPRKVVFALR
jgi:hypothetical protein